MTSFNWDEKISELRQYLARQRQLSPNTAEYQQLAAAIDVVVSEMEKQLHSLQ